MACSGLRIAIRVVRDTDERVEAEVEVEGDTGVEAGGVGTAPLRRVDTGLFGLIEAGRRLPAEGESGGSEG